MSAAEQVAASVVAAGYVAVAVMAVRNARAWAETARKWAEVERQWDEVANAWEALARQAEARKSLRTLVEQTEAKVRLSRNVLDPDGYNRAWSKNHGGDR